MCCEGCREKWAIAANTHFGFKLKQSHILKESEPLDSFRVPPQQLQSKGSLSPSVGLVHDTFQSNPQEQTHSQGFSIKELSPGISPLIDIVAIHGLEGHREASWTADNGSLWLHDFLPQRVPSARILTYGYDAYTQSVVASSTQILDGHAESFLARLASFRQISDTTEVPQKWPIIFIAHSAGGIILKHALMQANQACKGHLVEHRWIALSTYGILFLGTPHQGTLAITNPANELLNLASLSSRTNNVLLKHLIFNSEWLQQQLSSYNPISADFCTKFFYETLLTVLPDQSSQICLSKIVPKLSAVIPGAVNMEMIGMSKDHNGMTKFASQNDDDFIFISATIQDMTKKAPSLIQLWWSKFEHAEVLSNDYNYWRVIWIDTTNTMTLQNGFASIADDPDVKAQGVERSSDGVLEWLSHNRKKWLLIFDNADGMGDEIFQYVDKIRLIHALITSRSPVIMAHVTSSIEILPMNQDSAISLFETAAKLEKNSDTTMSAVSKNIVETLGSLPLAVDIAGATISAGLCTLYDYLKMYQVQTANLLDANHPSLKGASRYNHTVYSALDISYNLIETSVAFPETAQNALFILRVLGFFHHQNIMERIFKQAAESVPPVIYDEQLQTTTSDLPTHLLKCNENGEWTNMEFRQAMQVSCDYSLLSKGTARALLVGAILPGGTKEDIIGQWSLLLHIQAFRRKSYSEKGLGVYYDDMFSKFSMILGIFGQWDIAQDIQEVVLTKRDSVLAKAILARTYNHLGRPKEAEVLQLQVLEAQQLILGPEHSHTIVSKANLARTYNDLGRPKEAEVLQLQVLEAQQIILGPEHPDTIHAKANLASTYNLLGRPKAELLQLQVLEAQQLILGPEHPHTILAKAKLASTYNDLGSPKEAEVLQLQVLEAQQLILGPEHPHSILAKAKLASTYNDLGRPKEAEVLQLQVLEAHQLILGPEHPHTVVSKGYLARTYNDLGRPKEAEVLQLQVLEAQQIILGPEHPDTIHAKANLASTYNLLGKPKEAELLQLQVLEARQLTLGPEHPDTIHATATLASTYHDLRRPKEAEVLQLQPKEAEVLQLQVLEAEQLILGPEHPDTIHAKDNLVGTYCDLGRPKEAKVLECQVLEA
ncbi:hypothetical protein BU17DRAFT_61112 [Hysterangium stoloniferum]|nr:hypothetical protein BU17DRAFT_61112 [Hysterangium stoloniferum]